MGPKKLRIFISLSVLISNILISTATENQIEMQDLKTIKADQGFQLNYLLIYPTPASFKYIILPFLSSELILKTYFHFKNFLPNLDLGKWLEFFPSNIVLNLTDEQKTLFWIPSSSLKPILYSHNSKTAFIFQNFDPNLRPEIHCALLPSGIIKHLQSRGGTNFMVAEDLSEHDFFVTDENFVTIASGKVNPREFNKYLNIIEKLQNLTFWKKLILKIRYIVTMPFKKYLEFTIPFLTKMFSPLLTNSDGCAMGYLEEYMQLVDNSILEFTFYLVMPICVVFLIWIQYIISFFLYHTIIFPFRVLITPVEIFLFDFSFTTFCACPIIFFLSCTCCFSKNIDDFFIHALLHQFWYLDTLKLELSSFEIQPKNEMKLIPFLFPKENYCWFYLLFFVLEFAFSLLFKPLFQTWI